ncbi:hypothetical protein AB0F18_28375 [Streptomyces sp. NPDC029216]|uniref:hypothetical protein n=1 Tax=Streptomyces sp. NPDC029216 TaxID=3154701 RepID=UPI0033CA20E9
MVTARSPRPPRARSFAGLLHLLGLTLLLLGLVCAHGTGGSHSAADHSTPHASASIAAQASATVPEAAAVDRHDPAHPVHECAPLPPRAASAVDAPPAPAAPVEGCARSGLPASAVAAGPAAPVADTAPARTRGSAVLQV